jgi:hypothetical protein
VFLKATLDISNPDNRVEYSVGFASSFDFIEFDFDGFRRL